MVKERVVVYLAEILDPECERQQEDESDREQSRCFQKGDQIEAYHRQYPEVVL